MSYKLSNLQKNSLSVNNDKKIVISCQDRLVENTKDWLEIVKTLRVERDFDKSRILLGILEKNDKVVVKIGDDQNITHEYEIGEALKRRKGFMKFICYFECNDRFTSYPGNVSSRNYSSTEGGTYAPFGGYLCNGKGNTMKSIVMPHYELGSIGDYAWDKNNIDNLRSCLQQTALIIWINYSRYGFIHGDLHAKNILLNVVKSINETESNQLSYTINGKVVNIGKRGFDIVIMDFENSKIVDKSKICELMTFYLDLSKLFSHLSTFVKDLKAAALLKIVTHVGLLSSKMKFAEEDIIDIIPLIDDIEFE
jgi:hypothetical protein